MTWLILKKTCSCGSIVITCLTVNIKPRSTRLLIFLPNDTIRYAERQNSKTVNQSLNTQFTLTANRKDYYLNNVTIIENTPSTVTSNLQATSNNNIDQKLSGTVTNLSNKFNIIQKSKNGNVWEGFFFYQQYPEPGYAAGRAGHVCCTVK